MNDTKYTLSQWRGIRGMSQKRLSELTGITDTTIRGYEKDVHNLRKASYDNLELLAGALGISVNDIFLIPTSEKPNKLMQPA
ncbi:helix-turn-helix domain-containing protein [Leuconostoc fallax]|uniref:helix-turn-helix domain-containing protein n=1 Tax=Leuconostoc fallax TaxID=1251 RepID=UPI001C1F1DE0|nr:helix-turn-helix transcriptional regulator [Leuconostoc fallax]MBU7455719.1 helix-turn-helix transcriptional regulator [Leuconostoc fallax]